MANKTWKKFEKSDGFRRLKLKWKQLRGKEPKFSTDVSLATQNYSGWQVAPELLRENDIVYSFGICDDVGFEVDAITKNAVKIYAFDPTPYSVNWIKKQNLPDTFNFYPWAASGEDGEFFLYPRISKKGKKSAVMYTFHQQEEDRDDGVKVEAFTPKSAAEKLNHQQIDVLKMDIEGAEYAVIDSLLQSEMRPRVLFIEFHHRFKGLGKEKTIQAVSSLRENNYLLVSISVTGREMCFVHKTAL